MQKAFLQFAPKFGKKFRSMIEGKKKKKNLSKKKGFYLQKKNKEILLLKAFPICI